MNVPLLISPWHRWSASITSVPTILTTSVPSSNTVALEYNYPSSLGTSPRSRAAVYVYPNPTTGRVNLKLAEE